MGSGQIPANIITLAVSTPSLSRSWLAPRLLSADPLHSVVFLCSCGTPLPGSTWARAAFGRGEKDHYMGLRDMDCDTPGHQDTAGAQARQGY